MLIFNYYYNAYDEVDVYSIKNGTDSDLSAADVGQIVWASVGGVFSLISLVIIIWGCIKRCRGEPDDDS